MKIKKLFVVRVFGDSLYYLAENKHIVRKEIIDKEQISEEEFEEDYKIYEAKLIEI